MKFVVTIFEWLPIAVFLSVSVFVITFTVLCLLCLVLFELELHDYRVTKLVLSAVFTALFVPGVFLAGRKA